MIMFSNEVLLVIRRETAQVNIYRAAVLIIRGAVCDFHILILEGGEDRKKDSLPKPLRREGL